MIQHFPFLSLTSLTTTTNHSIKTSFLSHYQLTSHTLIQVIRSPPWTSIHFPHMWCVARSGISHYLAFAWSFERKRMHANAFFYLPVVSIRLCELAWRSNGSNKSQTLECWSNSLGAQAHSNLTTSECCFLTSKYHENCNATSSFTVIHHVFLRHGKLSFVVQLNVFISSLWFLFIEHYLF